MDEKSCQNGDAVSIVVQHLNQGPNPIHYCTDSESHEPNSGAVEHSRTFTDITVSALLIPTANLATTCTMYRLTVF